MRFLDGNNQELIYWPISGLRAGQDSQVIALGVEGVPAAASLTVSPDSRVSVLARRQGTSDPFLDIATNPINLSGFVGPVAWFDVKLRAAADLAGAPRVALSPGAISRTSAAWRA